MPSSGGQYWGWCPSCKNSGAAAARDVSERPLFQLWGWCPYWGLARDAPPHPFKVKLGDHFSAAPEITTRLGVGPGMWNTRDTPPLPERIGWVATPIYHDLDHHATLCCATTSAIVQLSEANPQGGQRRQTPSAWRQTQERNRTLRPSTQTLAAVLLLIGGSQRLKKTETPQRKPPKVHGQGPTISRRSLRL